MDGGGATCWNRAKHVVFAMRLHRIAFCSRASERSSVHRPWIESMSSSFGPSAGSASCHAWPRGTGARVDASVLTAAANVAAQQTALRFRRALRLAEPCAQARCNTRAARRRL
jgi:hypothetical protein